MRYQNTLVLARIRIDPDHQLPRQVLGTVGDQAVLTDRDDQIFGLEDKAIEVGPVNAGLAPLLRDGLLDSNQGGLEPLVAFHQRLDRQASGFEEEPSLFVGAVTAE